MDENRYSRNEALFGVEGQRRIAKTYVAIVGLGGLGCHVAQQLAYLGATRFLLIDGDIVTWSSLNRLIGAIEEDAREKRPKVHVAERLIRSVQSSAEVVAIHGWLDSDEARQAIAHAGVAFGCLDRERARLGLLDLAASQSLPYFDLASDTGGEGTGLWYGGRVVFSNGFGCPVCLEVLDQDELRREEMSPEELELEADLYGVKSSALAGTGPAVVSVNGVVASLAVTEFMAWVTGIREAAALVTYRGDGPSVRRSLDPPKPGCFYCSQYARSVAA